MVPVLRTPGAALRLTPCPGCPPPLLQAALPSTSAAAAAGAANDAIVRTRTYDLHITYDYYYRARQTLFPVCHAWHYLAGVPVHVLMARQACGCMCWVRHFRLVACT